MHPPQSCMCVQVLGSSSYQDKVSGISKLMRARRWTPAEEAASELPFLASLAAHTQDNCIPGSQSSHMHCWHVLWMRKAAEQLWQPKLVSATCPLVLLLIACLLLRIRVHGETNPKTSLETPSTMLEMCN